MEGGARPGLRAGRLLRKGRCTGRAVRRRAPDRMAVDQAGNLYVAGQSGGQGALVVVTARAALYQVSVRSPGSERRRTKMSRTNDPRRRGPDPTGALRC